MIISPSILSADFKKLESSINEVKNAPFLHIDIMDGEFVPNISFGPMVQSQIRPSFKEQVFDTHLMIEHPQNYIDAFAKAGSDYITFHIEADCDAKEVIDKANNYYDNSVLKAYCGENPGETKTIEYNENGNSFKGYYVKSEYKNLEELKKHLLTFLDESLIKTELKLSDINNKRMYDDYYEIDGNLYCRNYSGKGRLTRYTGNYDIEIINSSDSRISGNIVYEYLTEESSCDVKNLSKCSNSNFKYELGKFNIDKVDNNYVVTKIDFHE